MVDTKSLLPELRARVESLAEDLLARALNDAGIDAGLREAFAQIEKGGRTAQAFEVWREDYLEQVAVAWVLACVFVRFLEDNALIDECWLAGEGERRKAAEDAHEVFFREHPHESDRAYFEHVFAQVGKIPAARELFAKGKTPLWAVGPSGDAAMKLLGFWREIDPAKGHLRRTFAVEGGDTRFLGDLYQDLSEKARKKYALLQTPVFVEEFILDRTLDPAIDEFGLEHVRMIDPTCGSGHFLLGAFDRLFDLWAAREGNEIAAAQRALDGVWGVDINPFAVAIARFRLIAAAVRACGIRRLKDAPGWTVHLATGDSLLFGSRWNRTGRKVGEQTWFATDEGSWAPEIYACEDKDALQDVLGQQYHAVVGNPPYITVKDAKLNAAYRERYPDVCHRQYSLGVPFTERFFDLALAPENGRCGYVGMITANSFMKREFGKKLIEEFFPKVDLTHVIDTSGAYIPGHGTPTVILFGRNRSPVADVVRAVLGIKGEPSTPNEPSRGLVWHSILHKIDAANISDEFTSSADLLRTSFTCHPWSIGGGGAIELKDSIEAQCEVTIATFTVEIGFGSVTRDDDVFFCDMHDARRKGIADCYVRPQITGENVRDWVVTNEIAAIWPYNSLTLEPELSTATEHWFWPYRRQLCDRYAYGESQIERGLSWYEYSMFFKNRFKHLIQISFASVSTHNHFVLCRGQNLFNRHAPIMLLKPDATEDDHLALLGLLNSSTACFWMKQVFYPKATAVGDISTEKGRPEANRYEFAGTGLLSFPIPAGRRQAPSLVLEIARTIDQLATKSSELLPKAILARTPPGSMGASLTTALEVAAQEHEQIKRRMIALQEELDWEAYSAYSLAPTGASESILNDHHVGIRSEDRPFLWESDAAPAGVPQGWRPVYEERRRLLKSDSNLRLIETPVYKRPWWGRQGVYGQASRSYKEWVADACHDWLLDRLESPRYWPAVEFQTAARLADRASGDAEFLQVASLYRGRADFDVAALVAELVEGESVPFLPVLRYKPTGLRKRAVWERTWDLQRQEDAGKDVGDIPVPPKYTSADFLKQDYWRLRGKLDVPKERWIGYPHLQTESDPSLVVGWAGWDHLQQATALLSYYDARKRDGWDARRLAPILAGLDQLLPWIHQWHPEVDPEFGDTAGQSYQSLLENDAHELGLVLDQIRQWQPPEPPRKGRAPSKKKAVAEGDE